MKKFEFNINGEYYPINSEYIEYPHEYLEYLETYKIENEYRFLVRDSKAKEFLLGFNYSGLDEEYILPGQPTFSVQVICSYFDDELIRLNENTLMGIDDEFYELVDDQNGLIVHNEIKKFLSYNILLTHKYEIGRVPINSIDFEESDWLIKFENIEYK